MAMLATLEGPEVVESDDYILGRMFSPNDGLGVELLGVDGWNMAKRKAATAARNVLKAKRLFIVPEIIYCDPTPCRDDLAGVLFGLDESYCNELLGFSLTKSLKKAVSGAAKSVKSATKSATKKVKTASLNPFKSAKETAKAALKQAKKYSSPTEALKLSLSPTLQARAIAKTDPTGISTAVMDKTYKTAPDVLPTVTAYKTTKETVKYDPTGISQKLFKIGKKAAKAPDYLSPGKIYDETKKRTTKKNVTAPAEPVAPVQVNTAPADSITPQTPTIIYYPQTTPATTAPAEPVAPAGFDWSGLINIKTLAVGGVIAYFVFGRGKRGKRK